jgi:hypothetical protein
MKFTVMLRISGILKKSKTKKDYFQNKKPSSNRHAKPLHSTNTPSHTKNKSPYEGHQTI